jgi:hypothetical protein
LAEAAEAPVSPKLSLLLLARHRLGSNGPYTHAARIAFEQLGSELGVPLPERRTPELNANFVLTVIETPTPRLREAVRRVFERVIGGKPISPRLVSDQAHEAWRH